MMNRLLAVLAMFAFCSLAIAASGCCRCCCCGCNKERPATGSEELSVAPHLLREQTLMLSVLRVERSRGQTLAEVDGGERDGLRVGEVLHIADQGTFIANLRIVLVEPNRAVGIISLESPERGLVQVGQMALKLQSHDESQTDDAPSDQFVRPRLLSTHGIDVSRHQNL